MGWSLKPLGEGLGEGLPLHGVRAKRLTKRVDPKYKRGLSNGN
jgi:hypothetical protein